MKNRADRLQGEHFIRQWRKPGRTHRPGIVFLVPAAYFSELLLKMIELDNRSAYQIHELPSQKIAEHAAEHRGHRTHCRVPERFHWHRDCHRDQ
jgi:hypothetical protein